MNLEERVTALADGTRSVSKIAKELNADFEAVKEVVNQLRLNCPSKTKPKYEFIYKTYTYRIVWLLLEPGRGSGLYGEILSLIGATTAIAALMQWQIENPDHQAILADKSSHHPDRLIALPVELEPENLALGLGLQTSLSEVPELERVVKIEGEKSTFLSWNEYLIDLAKWQYPTELSFMKEKAKIWKAIRKEHGERLVWRLTQELNHTSPLRLYVTKKNFLWFLGHFSSIPEAGRSPRPIRGEAPTLSHTLEGYVLWQGWKKVRDLLILASLL